MGGKQDFFKWQLNHWEHHKPLNFWCGFLGQTLLVGGLNPSEKYESQWEGLSHILCKIKNV